MEGKTPSISAIVTYQRAMPAHSNPSWRNGALDLGSINGGSILNLVDNVAGLVALRHCRTRVVTASIDQMDFLNPVHVGELIVMKAAVNFTGRTSLEVGVAIEVENLYSGETTKTGKAYLTFVAVDEFGRAITVPPILPETEDEKRRYEEAKSRRAERLAKRNTG